MKRLILFCIISVAIIVTSAKQMSSGLDSKRTFNSLAGISSFPIFMAISAFNLERLVVGYLWLCFDIDSTGAARNYHRLLPYLELITTVKPDEFHAWGLATFMRCKRYESEDNPEKLQESMQLLIDAVKLYPDNDRGHYELAYMYAFFYRDYEKALEPAYQAWQLNSSSQMNFKLYHFVQEKLKLLQIKLKRGEL